MSIKKTKVFSKKTFSVKSDVLSFFLFLLVEIVTVSSARAQIIEGYPKISTPIVKEACKESLSVDDLTDQTFIKTPCGMYMLGYSQAAYVMWYALISETGYSEGTLTVVKHKPFCVDNPVRLADLAKLFVTEADLWPDHTETYLILLTALHKKYPCDEFFKEMDREFEANGVVTK